MKKVLLMLFLLVYSNVAMADVIPCNYNNPMLSHLFWKEATLEGVKKQVESGYSLNDTECDKLPPIVQAINYTKDKEIIEYMIKSGANLPRKIDVILGLDGEIHATGNVYMSCDFCSHYRAKNKEDALRHGNQGATLVTFKMSFVDYAYEKENADAAKIIRKYSSVFMRFFVKISLVFDYFKSLL